MSLQVRENPIQMIRIEKIHPHPDNPRKDLGDLTELADSIRQNGIRQNLTVITYLIEETVPEMGGKTKKERSREYMVIIGHRRLAAAKIAGLTELPCIVAEMDRAEQIECMIEENMQRKDLTDYEQGEGFQLMLDLGAARGETRKDIISRIHEKTGLSEATIRKRVRLIDLEIPREKLIDADERGGNLDDYLELEKIRKPENRDKVLDNIGTDNFRNELAKVIQSEKLDKMRDDMVAKLRDLGLSEISADDDLENYDAVNDIWHNTWNYENFDYEDIDDEAKYFCVTAKQVLILADADEDKDKDEAKDEHDADKAAKEAAAKQTEAARAAKTASLREIAARAYKLRMDFIKSGKITLKSKFGIIEKMAAEVLIFARGVYKEEILCELLDIAPADKDKLPQETRNHAITSSKNSTELLLYAVYTRIENTPAQHSCHNFNGDHYVNQSLSQLYDFLCDIGYRMSDDEKAWLDGTHEVFTSL
ncbi:MAG: ParB/RepB/Spo0J family partition protein [Defluviitaleaceae bacterium]|nr:ParB/RepB/Spo0J family partition protein [Defluviitaleaceae bacterium]